MEDKSHAIVAAAFLVIFSIGAVVVFMWLTASPPENRQYEIVTAEAVGSLQVNARVEFKGITVGHIHKIYFDPRNPTRIVIRFGVYPDAYITHATYATLGFGGITGSSYLDLHIQPGLPTTPLPTGLTHLARIPLKSGLLQTLEKSGMKDLKRIDVILSHVEMLLSQGNIQHISATLAHLDQAGTQLTRIEKELQPTIRSLPQVTEALHKALVKGQILENNVNHLVKNANQPVIEIGQAAQSITQTGQTGNRLLKRTDEMMIPRIGSLLEQLNQTANQVGRLARRLNHQPQSLIFGATLPSPGPGEPGFQPPR